MSGRDKKRVEAMIQNLQHKPPEWKMMFGTETVSAQEAIERLKKDQNFKQFLLDMADSFFIEQMLKG